MDAVGWVARLLAKLAALDVLPADETVGRDEDEHQRNIRDYYGLSLGLKATAAEVFDLDTSLESLSISGDLAKATEANDEAEGWGTWDRVAVEENLWVVLLEYTSGAGTV